MNKEIPQWLLASLALLAMVSVSAILTLSPNSYIYDEIYYHQYASDLASKGFGIKYLRELIAPPGPWHGLVHYFLSPITELNPIRMRLATNGLFFLVGVTIALVLFLGRVRNAWSAPLLAYSIPFAGVVFGVALTEVPAMLAASLGTLAVVQAVQADESSNNTGGGGIFWPSALPAVVAGFLFLAAVWGRQNYLAVLVALPLLFISRRGFLVGLWIVVTLIAVAGAVFLFSIWGGLVPEAVRFVSEGNKNESPQGELVGLNIVFGLRSLAYAGVLFAILAPRVFVFSKLLISLTGLVAFLLTIMYDPLRFLPSSYLLQMVLGPELVVFGGVLFGAFFTFTGLWLVASVSIHCWKILFCGGASSGLLDIDKRLYIFSVFTWLLIFGTNMKISHQFSSRYVVVAAPFLIITAAHHFRPNFFSFARLAFGFALSIFFLVNYYQWLD